MNILYCGDSNIEKGLIISILSLLKNVSDKLNIIVLTMELQTDKKKYIPVSDKTIKYIENLLKRSNIENSIKKIDCTDLFKKYYPESNIDTRFTPYCMLRLYVDLIDDIPDKILYLDNDVICNNNPLEYYNQNIENLELVGTLDYYGRFFFRSSIMHLTYINSGVLLLNIKKIRQTGLFKKCRDMCKNKKMFMPDQSAINKCVRYIKIVPGKYNEQRRYHENTVFQHFTTSFRFFPWFHILTIKPWQIDDVHSILKLNCYDDILSEYSNIMLEMRG